MEFQNKHEYCFRNLVINQSEYTIGCHILNKFPAHRIIHDFANYCGFYVVSGKGHYVDWNGKKHPLFPGCFVQHIPGLYHEIHRQKDHLWVEYSLYVHRELYLQLKPFSLINTQIPVYTLGLNSRLIKDFEDLHSFIKKCTNNQLLRCFIMIQNILASVIELSHNNGPQKIENSKMEMACDLLSLNLSKKIRLEDIARKLNMSYSHFRREFRNINGESPGEFRMRKRLEQAALILQQGDVSVKDVAYQMGYADPYIFSKQFKKIMGHNPSES